MEMKKEREASNIYQIEKGSRVGIICCSDGRRMEGFGPDSAAESDPELFALLQKLEAMGLRPTLSPCIYAGEGGTAGSGRQRAEALMDFYRDDSIRAIFDISGGNAANEVLPFLDFSVIAATDKLFWGYSDLTVILNAIHARTGKCSVLWQVRNLLYENGKEQEQALRAALFGERERNGKGEGPKKQEPLFSFPVRFLQKERMEGIVAGGNLRCLLKLAGTPFWPDLRGRILLLEALGGGEALIASGLSQLYQMGVFSQISGLLLGTFTELERKAPDTRMRLDALIREYAGQELPIAETPQVGHGADSAAVLIGGRLLLEDSLTSSGSFPSPRRSQNDI